MEMGISEEGVWKLKKYENAKAFNSSLCVNSRGILLDLMKASKVSESLK